MKSTDRYIVDESLFREAHEKVENLLTEMFGLEGNHHHNVEFILIDRERCEPMHFIPVPYSHLYNYSDKVLAKAMDVAMTNLSIAFDAVHRIHDQQRISIGQKTETMP